MKKLLIALLLSSSAHAARFVVEARHELTQKEMMSSRFKVEPFAFTKDKYFSKTYIVSGNTSKEEIQKLAWVKLVEETMDFQTLSLLPPEKPNRLVPDELFPFQWALYNQEQTYLKEKDDIHNLPLKGIAGKDIGWKETLILKTNKRPIVAVLDSGIDLNHPELQSSLWFNANECGKDSSVDNDKNSLPGDCQGWNFTEAIDSPAAKSVKDNDGHGTHVAGIIASARDGKGIVGIAPEALIMPIKVIRDSNSKSEVANSEAFARGIIYAVDNGADVINMSLGWPKSLETKYLLNAVNYALSKNVIIVAAGGNNNSSEPLFPCAYDGVICVAASTLDGSFAGFSNFGGHIDTVAPGEGILSLYPTLFEPDLFSVPGFEVKSGTSQAAPYVAGLVALLKSQKENLKIDDVFARIYQASEFHHSNKHILGGESNWSNFSQEVTTSVVRPILKDVRQVVLHNNTNGSLVIPFKNYGLDESNLSVKVSSNSKGIEFDSSEVRISGLSQFEIKVLEFPFSVKDLTAESNIEISITVSTISDSRVFKNNIPVVRDVNFDKNTQKLPFVFVGKALGVGSVKEGKLFSNLTTIESVVSSDKHEMYLRRAIKVDDQKKLEFTIFKLKNGAYRQLEKLILIDDVVSLVNFKRVDLNRDGREDYFIQTVVEKEGKKFFVFSFYDENGNDLWPKFQHAKLTLDVMVEALNEIQFVKSNTFLGEILLPSFFTRGQIPKIDQKISSFDRYDSTMKPRLYFLNPTEKNGFELRALTHNVWEANLKTVLKSKWYETVEVENILPTTAMNAANGEVRIIVSVGERSKRQIAIHTFTASSTKAGSKLPQNVLQTNSPDALYASSANGLDITGDIFFNIYDRSRAKIVKTKESSQVSELNITHQSETDLIAAHLVSFENGNESTTVVQTREELVTYTEINGQKSVSSRPKLRFSFMTQKLLSEMYAPVMYKRNGKTNPALYVDSTAVTGNRVSIFENQNGKLISSISNSLVISNNCRALNPKFSAEKGSFEFVLLCLENNEFSIKTLEMK